MDVGETKAENMFTPQIKAIVAHRHTYASFNLSSKTNNSNEDQVAQATVQGTVQACQGL